MIIVTYQLSYGIIVTYLIMVTNNNNLTNNNLTNKQLLINYNLTNIIITN